MIKHTFTVKETAQYIGVSKDLIYKMVRTKEIPFIRIGRRVLFRKESIDQWLHSQKIASDQKVDGVIF